MDIKGILFDKDGTLIEFHSFWVQAAKRVVPEFLTENQISPDQKHAEVVMEAIKKLQRKLQRHLQVRVFT